ncbi:MAG: type II toxin-antitoxin system PemK/MazF family toxin [Verrucomicrobia bacterium]|nr:type II toxin-antitoxin system PemK/MazF family toxin [Verrucomicrobiota bacterium]
MNAWDIYTYDFPEAGPHPAVIVSSPERTSRKPWVSVLLGSSQQASRPPNAAEVLLNGADGLDWETLLKCDLIHAVKKSDLRSKRGTVNPARRRQIVQRMIECNGWNRL